jgi:hypothetical protein
MGGVCNTNGGSGMHAEYLRERQKKRDHYGGQDLGGWIILKWREIECGGVD